MEPCLKPSCQCVQVSRVLRRGPSLLMCGESSGAYGEGDPKCHLPVSPQPSLSQQPTWGQAWPSGIFFLLTSGGNARGRDGQIWVLAPNTPECMTTLCHSLAV